MNYFKRLETIIIAVVILVLGLTYGVLNDKTDTQTNPANNQSENSGGASGSQLTDSENENKGENIFYSGQDGRTALDILKTFHSVETDNFGEVGQFVTSIDGVKADSSHFWAFYINGQMAQSGADTYITKNSENIEWKLEQIK